MPLLNTEYYLLFGNSLFYASSYFLGGAHKSPFSSILTSLNNIYSISQNSAQAFHVHLFEFRSLSSTFIENSVGAITTLY